MPDGIPAPRILQYIWQEKGVFRLGYALFYGMSGFSWIGAERSKPVIMETGIGGSGRRGKQGGAWRHRGIEGVNTGREMPQRPDPGLFCGKGMDNCCHPHLKKNPAAFLRGRDPCEAAESGAYDDSLACFSAARLNLLEMLQIVLARSFPAIAYSIALGIKSSGGISGASPDFSVLTTL